MNPRDLLKRRKAEAAAEGAASPPAGAGAAGGEPAPAGAPQPPAAAAGETGESAGRSAGAEGEAGGDGTLPEPSPLPAPSSSSPPAGSSAAPGVAPAGAGATGPAKATGTGTGASRAGGPRPAVRVDTALVARVERLTLIHDVARQFVSSLDLNELMVTVFDRVQKVLEAEAGSLWLVEEGTQDLRCQVAAGPEKDKVVGLKIAVGSGVVGWVVQKRRSTIVYDAAQDKRFSKAADRRTGFETKSMITVPLTVGDECLGAVQVLNKNRPGAKFTDDDLSLMEDLATYAAISIKNARLYQSQQRIRELNAILNISREITSTLDLDHVLITFVNTAGEVAPNDRCAVAMESGGRARVAAVSGLEKIDPQADDIRPMTTFMEFCLGREKEVYVADLEAYQQDESRAAPVVEYMKTARLASLWARPLMDEEGKLGVVLMESARKDFIPKPKFEILTILANQVTVALRNAQLYGARPFAGAFNRARRGRERFRSLPLWGKIALVGALVAALLLIFVIPLPSTVKASFEVQPLSVSTVYAPVEAVLDRVLVREGETVAEGQVLGYFEKDDFETALERARSREDDNKRALSAANQTGDPAQRARAENDLARARFDIADAEESIRRVTMRSKVAGQVLTTDRQARDGRHLEENEGKRLKDGDEVLAVARLDQVRVEIAVPEEEVRLIPDHAEVTFVASGYRGRAFTGTIRRIAARATQKGGGAVFIATVECDNVRDQNVYALRPGMTGRAKIAAPARTLFTRLLHWMGLV